MNRVKRIGVYIMISFLKFNGIHMEFTDQEIEDIALSTASGNMEI